jgi:surfeit locus 1 family protein
VKLNSKSIALFAMVVMIFFVLFIMLGIWQLHRAEQRDAQYIAQLERKELPPIRLEGGDVYQPEWEYRQVETIGTFEPDHQILLDNKMHKGKAGYEVLTPLRIRGADSLVLVNRGWVPAGNDRSVLPVIETPTGEVAVSGTIGVPSASHFRPGISKPGALDGGVWLYLDIQYLVDNTKLPWLPFMILQSPEDAGGFVREWPEPESKGSMHLGYAAQWFIFAVILMGMFIWMVMKEIGEGNKK